MATTRSKKSGDSKPVEKKQVEAPKAKEAKEEPKPVEKKQVEAPKAKEVKEAPKPVEKKAAASKILKVEHLNFKHLGIGEVLKEYTNQKNGLKYMTVKFSDRTANYQAAKLRFIGEK